MSRGQSRVLMWYPAKAGAAVGKHTIVKPSAAGTVTECSAATDGMIGVAGSEDVASGDTVEVAVAGIANVIAAEAITRGDLISSDGNGEAATADTKTDRVVGVAVESAADGDIFPILLAPGIRGDTA